MAIETHEKLKKREGRLLVSRGQFVFVLGKKVGLGSLGLTGFLACCLCLMGSLSMLITLVAGSMRFLVHTEISFLAALEFVLSTLFALIALATTGWGIGEYSCEVFQEITELDPVALINRRTLDELPAGESLVRSAYEPLQMLLRPTLAKEETPREQLLRFDADVSEERQVWK